MPSVGTELTSRDPRTPLLTDPQRVDSVCIHLHFMFISIHIHIHRNESFRAHSEQPLLFSFSFSFLFPPSTGNIDRF